jgi:hypothetical protein
MHAGARQIPTRDRRARLHVGEVEEVLPAEEVLADVGDPALHFRFPGGVARNSGIDDETAVLRVLEEDARDRGRIAIGAGDDRLEIIDDQPARHAAEEPPRRFQAVEDGLEILPQTQPEKRVATVPEGDEESVDPAPASRRWIGPQSQPAEIDLGPPRRVAARRPAPSPPPPRTPTWRCAKRCSEL